MPGTWRLFVDVGGTFTDGLALGPEGEVRRAKVLSHGALRGTLLDRPGPRTLRVRTAAPLPPGFLGGMRLRLLGDAATDPVLILAQEDDGTLALAADAPPGALPGAPFEALSGEEAPVLVARLLTASPPGHPLPPLSLRLATTRGTNALLERRVARVAVFLTEGHGDLLEIGTQQRPDLFALRVEKPAPLHAAAAEVPGRLDAAGREVRPLDLEALRRAARRLRAEGCDAAAVALLHSHRDPAHERAAGAALREEGFTTVALSSDLAPFLGLLARATTATVEACLAPVLGAFLARVREGLGGDAAALHLMTSAGGLVRADAFRAKDGLLSGPAAGVVGAARAGRRAGFPRVLAFDMGGTSTDVARFDGELEVVFEHAVGDALLRAPALAVETVAAGGGSLCTRRDGRLEVGPGSAGARPGPACYGAGGPLTLTDVNLLLGRLVPDRFEIPLDRGAAEAALATVLGAESGAPPAEQVLEGFLAVAEERMAGAIRSVSVRRGFDPADHALVAFGGAGGQHACAVAERLGIGTVVVPTEAGLLSARGLAAARVERMAERQVLRPLEEAGAALPGLLDELGAEATAAVAAEGVPAGTVEVRRRLLEMRFAGQDAGIPVEVADAAEAGPAFLERYRTVFGDPPANRAVEVVTARVLAAARAEEEPPPPPAPAPFDALPAGRSRAWIGGGPVETARFDRETLAPGARLTGPAVVAERFGTTVVRQGWTLTVDGEGALVLRRGEEASGAASRVRPAGAERELFTHRFEGVAREMGEMLRRTAVSVNVKERLDFSCAVLDPAGSLVVNAPHIPVHLGSLGLCVRAAVEILRPGPGDVVVVNHPAFGGSHLPDVTVMEAVADGEGRALGYVAARAHHAEIGGIRPGSLPPDARSLAEEGVVIPPIFAVRGGEGRWEAIRALLLAGPHPTRAVEDNVADLRAAAAACRRGAEALRSMAREHGRETVLRHMEELQRWSGERAAAALAALGAGRREAEERLDDGTPLRVAVETGRGRTRIDFTGSGPVHPGSLNATPAVVRSAVLYAVRLLVDRPLPLNEGLLRDVEVILPEGFLNPPFPADPALCPAVVGGNVETSQRVVDALLRAFGAAAASQGTMNNVAFGNARFGFYETVGGGTGAGPGFHGASAVHSHMTNTRITDAEVMEHRYPVRVERFAVRRGSGGAGRWRGGDGIEREILFLEPCTLSFLGERRRWGPPGMEGGGDGAAGRQRVVRADGTVEELPGAASVEMGPGDRFVLETPGGGGWG